MGTTRSYTVKRHESFTMPAADDERRLLVVSLCRMTETYFGYPARQANVAGWLRMPVEQLRRVHDKWETFVEVRSKAK